VCGTIAIDPDLAAQAKKLVEDESEKTTIALSILIPSAFITAVIMVSVMCIFCIASIVVWKRKKKMKLLKAKLLLLEGKDDVEISWSSAAEHMLDMELVNVNHFVSKLKTAKETTVTGVSSKKKKTSTYSHAEQQNVMMTFVDGSEETTMTGENETSIFDLDASATESDGDNDYMGDAFAEAILSIDAKQLAAAQSDSGDNNDYMGDGFAEAILSVDATQLTAFATTSTNRSSSSSSNSSSTITAASTTTSSSSSRTTSSSSSSSGRIYTHSSNRF
jgi:hypothetical protein